MKNERVKAFFDKPEKYLKDDYDISIRALIVRELLGDVSNIKMLDIGCGDGSISLQFSSDTNQITLVDISEKMLELARNNTSDIYIENSEYINSDLLSYETNEQFDIVLCIGVLAHVDSIEQTIAKVSSLLKPGGRCIIQITDNDKMTGKFINTYNGVRNLFDSLSRYSLNKTGLSQIVSLAHRNKLTLVTKRQYLSPLLGMGMLSDEWLYKYEYFTLTHDFFSKFGSETLGLYKKDL